MIISVRSLFGSLLLAAFSHYSSSCWPSGRASNWRVVDLDSIPSFSVDHFPGRVIPLAYRLVLQWLSCHVPGAVGSVLGLVGPVSIYCEWVREKF